MNIIEKIVFDLCMMLPGFTMADVAKAMLKAIITGFEKLSDILEPVALPAPNVDFPEYPKYPEKLHMNYYKAPLLDVKDCFDMTEQELINGVCFAKSAKQALYFLRKFIAYEEAQRKPFVARRMAFTTLPSSIMLAGLMKVLIKDGATTDLADMRYSCDLKVSRKALEKASPEEKRDVEFYLDKALRSYVERLVSNGVTYTSKEGVKTHYGFFTSPPAGLKKMSGYFLSSDAWQLPEVKTASWFGLSPAEINRLTKGKIVFPKQIMQMRGLYTSSAIPSSKFFDDGRYIDPKKVIVLPKVRRTLSGLVREVRGLSPADQQEKFRTDLDRAFGDGQSIGNPRKFGKLCCQLRYLGFKGLMVGFDIVAWAQYRGIAPVVTDIYDVKHDLSKEDWDLLTTTDSWKLGKVFSHWDDCRKAAESMGITEFYICAMNSVERMTVNVARQCWNSLFAILNKDLEHYIKPALKKVNKADTVEGAARLLREDFAEELSDKTGLAQCIALDSELVGISAIFRKIALIKESKFCKIAGGSVQMPGVSAYLVDDPALMADGWLGIDVNNNYAGLLRPGQVYIPDCTRTSGLIALLRYPHAYMEWATLNLTSSEWLRKWLPEHVCVINGHDLTPRILMFDVDGDHATIVFSESLAKLAKAIKDRFHIIPLYYDPASAEGCPVGENKADFVKQATECIALCHAYNKVGPYSNVIRTVWSMIDVDPETIWKDGLDTIVYDDGYLQYNLRQLLLYASYGAQKVNEAVDAQKTYKLEFIDEIFSETFSGIPDNQRFRDHSPEDNKENKNKRYDSCEWVKNERLMPRMKGTTDRITDICFKYSDPELHLDVEKLNPDLKNFLDQRYLTGYQPIKSAASDDLLYDMEYIGRINTDHGEAIMSDLKNGTASFSDILHLLHCMYGESFSTFAKNSDDELEKSAHYVEQISRIQNIIADYYRLADKYSYMSFDEALHAAGNSALRTVINLSNKNDPTDDKFILFCFDVFGEVWAENAENNVL